LTLISWTYPFYGTHRDIALDLPGIEQILESPEPSAAEIAEIESLARKVRRWLHRLGDAMPLYGRMIARPDLRLTLTEARRYLCNRDGIATQIREMLKQPLRKAWDAGEEVLLIAHSMGSVIAYDTLWELAHEDRDTRRVDLFVTLGSPLASHFIRRRLLGRNLHGRARYPTNIKRWENFAARAEMTALRPRLARYFGEMQTLGLLESLVDHTDIYNHFHGEAGLNVHMSYGYLINNAVAGTIADWLLATETTASANRS
jgi:pimeloyl-ACP methyl ester carboxylesterase